MNLSSPSFENGGKIQKKFTCDGQDISPELIVSGVPSNAKSLALIMEDPDVPKSIRSDGMWDHWVAWNIPPETKKIPEGHHPKTEGNNTSGKLGYQGPCPPDREHRYFFKLFALNSVLSLKSGSSKRDLEKAMEGHILEKAELMGKYSRK